MAEPRSIGRCWGPEGRARARAWWQPRPTAHPRSRSTGRPAGAASSHSRLVILELSGDVITEMTTYLDAARLFPLFDLPADIMADR